MKTANINDKQKVISIIEESFNDNPSIKWLIKNDDKKKRKLRALAEYMFDAGMNKNGVYLSSDNESVAICYLENGTDNPLKDCVLILKLIIKALGFRNAFKVFKRQQYLKGYRPFESDYLYFWLFGSSNKGKGCGGAFELQKGIFEMSEKLKLPIYMETSVKKNRIVYERFGFNVYHTWLLKKQSISMWLMRRNPKDYIEISNL